MSESELVRCVQQIEVNSSLSSDIRDNSQPRSSIITVDTSTNPSADAQQRGIHSVSQKRELVLASMAEPREADDSISRGATAAQRESEPEDSGPTRDEVPPQDSDGTPRNNAPTAMDVDSQRRGDSTPVFDTQALLSQFNSLVPSRTPQLHGNPYGRGSSTNSRQGDQDGRESPFEQRVRRRGWKALNRWVNPGFYREYENFSLFDNYTGRPVQVGDILGGRVNPADRNTANFRLHLDVTANDILRDVRMYFIPMVFEHLDRLSYKNLSLLQQGYQVFDVAWARNRDELAYCQWLSSDAFRALERQMNEIAPGVLPRVVGMLLSWRSSIAPYSSVPWERYPKDVTLHEDAAAAQLVSPEYYLVAPTAVHYQSTRMGSSQLVVRPSMQDEDGSFVGYTVLPVSLSEELENYLPAAWRRWERTRRHKFQRLIAGHQCEVELLNPSAISSRYPPLPSWWRDVEVPYGFYNVMPYIVTYRGSSLLQNPKTSDMVLLRSEWAFSVATHLMYEARGGRLWWVPLPVRKDIESMGFCSPMESLSDEENALRKKLASLLEYISSLAWYKIPRNGKIKEYPDVGDFECSGGEDPAHIGGITPVHRGADWVVFDAEYWCLHLPDDYFVEFVDAEHRYFQPDDPRRDRLRDYDLKLPHERNISNSGVDLRMAAWQDAQIARVRRQDATLASRLETRLPRRDEVDVDRRERGISKQRSSSHAGINASLAAYLARQGITDVESFVAMQEGLARNSQDQNPDNRPSTSGAGPSSQRE